MERSLVASTSTLTSQRGAEVEQVEVFGALDLAGQVGAGERAGGEAKAVDVALRAGELHIGRAGAKAETRMIGAADSGVIDQKRSRLCRRTKAVVATLVEGADGSPWAPRRPRMLAMRHWPASGERQHDVTGLS
jgi:hypothetical protein